MFCEVWNIIWRELEKYFHMNINYPEHGRCGAGMRRRRASDRWLSGLVGIGDNSRELNN